MAENIRVGKDGCDINRVVITITRSTAFARLNEKWTMLAKSLGIPDEDVIPLRRSLNLELRQLSDVINDLISGWVARKSDKATLNVLNQELRDLGLTEIANDLSTEFVKISKKADTTSGTTSTAKLLPPEATKSPPVFDQTALVAQRNRILFGMEVQELIYNHSDKAKELNEQEDGLSCFGFGKAKVEGEDVIDFRSARILDNINVIRPTTVMNFGEADNYKLPAEGSKGEMLVLNLIEYDFPGKTRKGAKLDSIYMQTVWSQLGYNVQVEDQRRFTSSDIKSVIEKFRKKCERISPASVIIFIGGHGGNDVLFPSDFKKPVNLYKDVMYQFSNSNCKALDRKPKIFLLSACQEFVDDEYIPNCFDPTAEPIADAKQKMELNHAILCYSTLPGFFSHRYACLGTVYAYCLTRVLIEHAHEMDFIKILDKLQETMEKVKTGRSINQMPNYRNIGLKGLYFNMPPNSN